MTDEELIEQIARTVGQKIEGAAEDMDSPWYGAPLWAAYIEEARAILPFIHADREAVRAEIARAIEVELSMCALANVEAPSEWIDGFEFAWKRVKEVLGKGHD